MRKKQLLAGTWVIIALFWAAIATCGIAGIGTTAWVVLVTAGALALEAAFWITAAILGITVFESRRRIFALLRGRLGRADDR